MKKRKIAFITGITGQDGSYLAEFLLKKGYEVHSIMRRASVFTSARIDHLVGKENFIIHHGDLADSSNSYYKKSFWNEVEYFASLIIFAISVLIKKWLIQF